MILRARKCNIFQNTRFSLATSINQSNAVITKEGGGAVVQAKRETWNLIYKNDEGIHAVRNQSWKKQEVGKFEMKLERMKLESSSRSWKIFDYFKQH